MEKMKNGNAVCVCVEQALLFSFSSERVFQFHCFPCPRLPRLKENSVFLRAFPSSRLDAFNELDRVTMQKSEMSLRDIIIYVVHDAIASCQPCLRL